MDRKETGWNGRLTFHMMCEVFFFACKKSSEWRAKSTYLEKWYAQWLEVWDPESSRPPFESWPCL